jgi:hypothetical protein
MWAVLMTACCLSLQDDSTRSLQGSVLVVGQGFSQPDAELAQRLADSNATVVRDSWLSACIAAQARAPLDKHLVPPTWHKAASGPLTATTACHAASSAQHHPQRKQQQQQQWQGLGSSAGVTSNERKRRLDGLISTSHQNPDSLVAAAPPAADATNATHSTPAYGALSMQQRQAAAAYATLLPPPKRPHTAAGTTAPSTSPTAGDAAINQLTGSNTLDTIELSYGPVDPHTYVQGQSQGYLALDTSAAAAAAAAASQQVSGSPQLSHTTADALATYAATRAWVPVAASSSSNSSRSRGWGPGEQQGLPGVSPVQGEAHVQLEPLQGRPIDDVPVTTDATAGSQAPALQQQQPQ